MSTRSSWIVFVILVAASGCTSTPNPSMKSVTSEPFGTMPDGGHANLYTLTNPYGVEMRVTDYGGIIVSLKVPDREGQFDDIVLGYDRLDDYLADTPYFGALIGRFGNRIAEGRFSLDGETFGLARNNGPNHLHGGVVGFDKVLWHAESFENEEGLGLVLTYASPDGEEGYPGTLSVRVTYTLTDDSRLIFEYEATTDRATPVNLTQHSYFNLAGHDSGSILEHDLMIAASRFTPISESLIPTGELRSVEGTPFDFRSITSIGARINSEDEQLSNGLGYDHNFVLDGSPSEMYLAARVTEPTSGRVMEVYTTEPGIQFYSGNFLDGSLTGKGGHVYNHRTGFCLETQHFPDSPNQPDFPSTILRPGETYSTRTVYTFSTDR